MRGRGEPCCGREPASTSSRRATSARTVRFAARGRPSRRWAPTSSTRFSPSEPICVLATVTPTVADRRPDRSAFTILGDSIWFATVAGGRLRNLERSPWVSVVVDEGEGDEHRAVAADGPVTLFDEPPDGAARALGAAIRLARRMGCQVVRAAPRAALLLTVPEGDTLHRAAARLQPLVGQRVEVSSSASACTGRAGRRAARRPASSSRSRRSART